MPRFNASHTEVQWQSQLAAMKLGLQNCKFPEIAQHADQISYKSEIEYDDDISTSVNSSSEIWDFISESEGDLSSQFEEDLGQETDTPSFDLQWLETKCQDLAKRNQGLTTEDLKEQIITLLVSESTEQELESVLTDIIGLSDFDFIINIITHRSEIKNFISISKTLHENETLYGRLLTKSQRQELLKKKDFEHKNTKLGKSSNVTETHYPHIYKAHSAGNTLDFKGQKYGLPAGSKTNSTEASFCTLSLSSIKALNDYRNMRNISFPVHK